MEISKCKTIWDHFKSWPELWIGLPIGTLTIPAAAYFVYILTGRAPQENMDYMIDLAGRIQTAAWIVVSASVTREALGNWYTKKEAMENRYIATLSTLSRAFYLLFYAWLYTK